jgi:hypothetical protein
MKRSRSVRLAVRALCVATSGAFPLAQAAQPAQTAKPAEPPQPYEPSVGQAGKDVVWVPTPQVLVDKMLDMAKVTPNDFLIDLGSGDGRTVITAAKRGVRAKGIEYEPNMVALSRKNAQEAGVSNLATFDNADLFTSDFSQATVITMFLLPSINLKLRPTILDLKPGTRIVSNTFTMDDWEADETARVEDGCTSTWCTALLWYVPAKVAGRWQVGNETLTLTQTFQMLTGTLGSTPITDGRMKGSTITFTAGKRQFTGEVSAAMMTGTAKGEGPSSWTATKTAP